MSTDKRSVNSTPELWGGIECSCTRIQNQFIDQLQLTGHDARGIPDLDQFGRLGFSRVRYPVLWERHQPEKDGVINWDWSANQLAALQRSGIEPIAGLLHHGNGPLFTNLLDREFPNLFARYARAVAARFPWIQYYTPINEPLTTSRFSGLYGLWYPHRRNDRDFALIFLNQMKATILAMEAIREVNPAAKLLQTEDLSKTYSTPFLQYQADFENERRWLTCDVLCGNFRPGHALWDFFEGLDLPASLLHFFEDRHCRPDAIGADHYLTSERFLDERMEQYPLSKRGGNHRHHYADVEAIRVNHRQPWGLELLLRECWERFAIPIAVTEVHVNGDSNDRIRWFKDVWNQIMNAAGEGVEIVALTSWSLLGSFGWENLLTSPIGRYEAGAFNVASGEAVLTDFGRYLHRFRSDPDHYHPALEHPGWWHQSNRCFYDIDPSCREVDLINPPLKQKVV